LTENKEKKKSIKGTVGGILSEPPTNELKAGFLMLIIKMNPFSNRKTRISF